MSFRDFSILEPKETPTAHQQSFVVDKVAAKIYPNMKLSTDQSSFIVKSKLKGLKPIAGFKLGPTSDQQKDLKSLVKLMVPSSSIALLRDSLASRGTS